MIKLGIVDDHQLFLEGIRLILTKAENIEVVFSTTNPEKVMDILENQEIDILITDISMPKVNGIELIKSVKQKHSDIKIVVMSAYEEMQSEKDVDAYLLKDTTKDLLISVLHNLHFNNKKYFYSNSIQYEKIDFKKQILSKREKEIVREICNGLSSQQISEKLFISTNTVESHRKNIFFKLNINSTAQLVNIAIKLGIILH